jgi:hypothetical protein
MQLTLNRQLGRSLQYFLTYTFSKALGTAAVNESDGDQSIDPLNGKNSYGILNRSTGRTYSTFRTITTCRTLQGDLSTTGSCAGLSMAGKMSAV